MAVLLRRDCECRGRDEWDGGGNHWSLAPLEPPTPPDTARRSPIDAFVAARLEASGLTLSKPASPGAWLRRVYFDLIGLPPSPQDLNAFLSDLSPRAEERVVDRLLASPRYGERWARHWMDTVRYAETHGHDEDAIRENAWPYRDWLIRAFNDDKPYAEFIREQIAGDIISSDDPRAIAATGFLACGPWDSSSQMGIQDGTTDKKIAQYLDRDDMLSATMSTFTSTTVHCARCHNHKFDPVPTADYYALQAVFAGVDKVDRPYDDDPQLAHKRAQLLREAQDFESLVDSPELAEEIADWIESLEGSIGQWSVLPTETVASEAGSPFEIQTDGSIRFGGTAAETDTYTITGAPGLSRLTAIQLEVMTDSSFPEEGPGRAPNGNLHLSEIQVSADGKDLPIGRAIADFNQSDWEIDKAVDGKDETAWGIHPEESKPHRAVFVFREALALTENSTIVIVLRQVPWRQSPHRAAAALRDRLARTGSRCRAAP